MDKIVSFHLYGLDMDSDVNPFYPYLYELKLVEDHMNPFKKSKENMTDPFNLIWQNDFILLYMD